MKPFALIAVVLAVLSTAPVSTAAPGTPVVASANVELLATVPVEAGAIGGKVRSIGGRDYFLMTGYAGVSVYDITTPELPILVSRLPLPHIENEDVEMSDDLMLVAADPGFQVYGGLYLIDLTQLPLLRPAYVNPATANLFRAGGYRGGHTVSCVAEGANDCAYAYAMGPGGGSNDAFVIDVRNPSAPAVVLEFESPVGSTHDVKTDEAGIAWFVGSRGFAAYDTSNPAVPVLISKNKTADNVDGLSYYHSSLRPDAGDTLLITEENYVTVQCQDQGRFATASLEGFDAPDSTDDDGNPIAPASVRVLDRWTPELGETKTAGTIVDGNQPVASVCSAHWFDEQDGIVAIGWYQQGVRFLDVSDPANIREVGWFLTPTSMAWDAQWITDDIAYVIDNNRGLDVLRIAGGGVGAPDAAPAPAPSLNRPDAQAAKPHPQWGYGCAVASAF